MGEIEMAEMIFEGVPLPGGVGQRAIRICDFFTKHRHRSHPKAVRYRALVEGFPFR